VSPQCVGRVPLNTALISAREVVCELERWMAGTDNHEINHLSPANVTFLKHASAKSASTRENKGGGGACT
jgi:hypothetical protein